MDDIGISPLEEKDIDGTREMQAIVWQHYFKSEMNKDAPLMMRSRKNLEYYMKKDGGRILVARRGSEIVGNIVCHVWGKVGWFGPFEVRPEFQNRGIGKRLAAAAVDYLKAEGCETVGLETMASSSRNVAFYAKLGFGPKKLSYVLHKDLVGHPPGPSGVSPREILEGDMPHLRKTWNDIHPGLDYSAEVKGTRDFGLGRVVGVHSGDLLAHTIYHDYELIEESGTALVKLMVCRPDDLGLLDWCENRAAESGKKGIFVRFYQGNGIALEQLLSRNYRLTGVLVRMQSDGPAEETGLGHIACWSG